MIAAGTPLAFKAQTRALAPPAARGRWPSAGIFDSPGALRPELIWEFFDGGDARPGPSSRRSPASPATTSSTASREIDVPTLIVWGRQDHVVPPADALGYASGSPARELEVFDRCGHVPMAERPVRFNRVLDGFLAE